MATLNLWVPPLLFNEHQDTEVWSVAQLAPLQISSQFPGFCAALFSVFQVTPASASPSCPRLYILQEIPSIDFSVNPCYTTLALSTWNDEKNKHWTCFIGLISLESKKLVHVTVIVISFHMAPFIISHPKRDLSEFSWLSPPSSLILLQLLLNLTILYSVYSIDTNVLFTLVFLSALSSAWWVWVWCCLLIQFAIRITHTHIPLPGQHDDLFLRIM